MKFNSVKQNRLNLKTLKNPFLINNVGKDTSSFLGFFFFSNSAFHRACLQLAAVASLCYGSGL